MKKVILKFFVALLIAVITFWATTQYIMSHARIYLNNDVVEIVIFGNVWEHGIAE